MLFSIRAASYSRGFSGLAMLSGTVCRRILVVAGTQATEKLLAADLQLR
jgi:hypothetical protein